MYKGKSKELYMYKQREKWGVTHLPTDKCRRRELYITFFFKGGGGVAQVQTKAEIGELYMYK